MADHDGLPGLSNEDYIASLPEVPAAWVREFQAYVATTYPWVPLVMFRSVPMFKFGTSYLDGYVMFTAAKAHFTTHALEFDLIEELQGRLPSASFGKGSIKVKYTDEAAKPVLYEFVDEVMRRNDIPRAGGSTT